MILTLVRRLLMLCCIIGILVLMVLWLMAENQAGSNPSKGSVKGSLRVYGEASPECDRFLDTLKGQGYTAVVKSERGTRDKLAGYSVYSDFTESAVDKMKEYLEAKRFKVVKTESSKEGKSRLQVGGTYPNKQQAQAVINSIARDLDLVFDMEPVYKQVPATLYFLQIENIDEATAAKLEETFKEKSKNIKFVENPPEQSKK